jgi:hypothetical protein
MALDPQQIQASIAKAREAQKKFQETKAKVEAAKKKADAAVKKAREIQQQIKLIQALSKTPGGTKAGISAIIAGQVGNLKGKVVSQIQKEVLSILNKFASDCPNTKDLERIIKIKNTLLSHLTSFEKRINVFSNTATQLTTAAQTVNNLIKVITSIPIPTVLTFIPGQSGGLVRGVPYSTLTRYSNTLVKLNKTVDRLLGEATAITSTISTVKPLITSLKNRLNLIDISIEQCSLEQAAEGGLAQIVASAQPPENTGSEGTPNDDYLYKGYILEIVDDPNSPSIAPRRYAIAKDTVGVIVLYGPSSFSSDTQVLLDEIKFRIDNQLP